MPPRDRSFKAFLFGWRPRRLYHIFVLSLLSWALASLYFYSTFDVDMSFDSLFYETFGAPLSSETLRELMGPRDVNSVPNSLSKLIRYDDKMLQFYYLPKRMVATQYAEITSANRDTSYPLAPDFTFHIRYAADHVVLYEDAGPGCVYRIYMLPVMPRATTELHKITSKDLSESTLSFQIDGQQLSVSLYHIAEGDDWPFLYPISPHRPRPSVGLGAYTPICYQDSIAIKYHPSEPLPLNLFRTMTNCSKNDLFCPIHIYSAVSRHKFPVGTRVESFSDPQLRERNVAVVKRASELLQHPEKNGPDKAERCALECLILCKGCRQVLFMSKTPEVISAMRFRVFDAFSGVVITDWSNILLTVHLDGSPVPQLNRVPLGAIFAASSSLNDFMGAAVGRRKHFCTYHDGISALPSTTSTGYIYFPMPFWKEATIYIDGTNFITQSQLVCMQINTVENFYEQEDTGHFHAVSTHYTDDVTGWRNVLTLQNTWGHVVGLAMEVDNLRAVRNVPLNERWAALQADADIFIDGQKSASVLGTGLEDYFSYAHGFTLGENTSYSFVGVPHTAPRRKEPLTWHCYRLHVLDPIPFQESIQFIMEGTGDHFQRPVQNIPYEEHLARKHSDKTSISHLIYFYAKTQTESKVLLRTDFIELADTQSEVDHSFVILKRSSSDSGSLFHLTDTRYLGACNIDEQFDKRGRMFSEGDELKFALTIDRRNKGVILRRAFHSTPMDSWNELAHIRVGDVDYGKWVISMGTLVDEYSLRHEDFMIHPKDTQGLETIVIELEILSSWRDISYTALNIM